MDQSILLSVTPDAAAHPVARAVEREQIGSFGADLEALALMAADGAPMLHLVDDCVQMVSLAMLASMGYDLPEEVQALFIAAMDALTAMGNAGGTWRAKDGPMIADAASTAAAMFAALPPDDRNRAAFELRQLDRAASINVARQMQAAA